MILEQKTQKVPAKQWWNHWKGSWKIVLIWKFSSVKYHPWKTQTYKQRETFSTHLFVLNWWKIQMSLLRLMKTCISLHWRTPSIPVLRGCLSSPEILADIYIIYFGKGRGDSPDVISYNRINYINSNVEIHLDGKTVGSHGCGGRYWVVTDYIWIKKIVEAPGCISTFRFTSKSDSVIGTKYYFSRLEVLPTI